jgi:hypothetical protein
MALFCRSLTVENHLLSYQEMRPKGGGVATAAAGSAEGRYSGSAPFMSQASKKQ